MKLYGEISKTEELDDGTIKVFGFASSASVDSDGETITAEAMKAALPDYMKFGAVREMHQPKAAGTAIEADVKDDGRTWFGAHIVDSEAVKKVKAGVYKGFSVGGKVTERDRMNKSLIKAVKLVEVSLVDRPANPDAVFTMFKADSVAPSVPAIDALAEILNKGAVTPEQLLEIAQGLQDAKEAEKTNGMTKAEAVEELRKYSGGEIGKEIEDASRAMQALDTIRWLLFAEQAEREMTPENQEQVQILTGVIAGLKRFIVSELMENEEGEGEEGEEKEAAASSGDLNKAGARFSASTRDALAKCHEAMKVAVASLDELGYQGDEGEPTEKAESAEELRKAADLAKAELTDKLAKAEARIAELEAMPVTDNIPAAMAIEKGAELFAGQSKEKEPHLIYKADGSIDERASQHELMKFAIQPTRAQRIGY